MTRCLSLLALAGALLATGCASEPRTQFHTLMAAAPPGPVAKRPDGPPLAFSLAMTSVPAQADRPQWVLRLPDGGAQLLEQQRWISPLGDEWRAALADRLTQQLGAIDTGRQPAAANLPPALRLQIALQRFDSSIGQEAVQQTLWTLQPPADSTAPSVTCSSLLREPAVGDYSAMAAAHRALVARLADAIGSAMSAMQAGQTVACPG
jgi:uncharacterized lipoprotein YmbA